MLSDGSDDAEIKIVDLGLSRAFDKKQLMKTVCGTHKYLAPELVECDRGLVKGCVAMPASPCAPLPLHTLLSLHSSSSPLIIEPRALCFGCMRAPGCARRRYDKAVDMWGIGMLAYIMLFGSNPFARESMLATHEAILQCNLPFPNSNVSPEARRFVLALLKRSPKDRLTASQALLNSAWLEQEFAEKSLDEISKPLVVALHNAKDESPRSVEAGSGRLSPTDTDTPKRPVKQKIWEWYAEKVVSSAIKSTHRRLSRDALAEVAPAPASVAGGAEQFQRRDSRYSV